MRRATRAPHTTAFDERLGSLGRAFASWPASAHFERAVADTVVATGYVATHVEEQLLRIARQCATDSLRTAIDGELAAHGGVDALARGELQAPCETLHLAAATVPGLLLESLAWGIAIGSANQCRPSRDDRGFLPFLQHLLHAEPMLGTRVEHVREVRWQTPDAAAVYGDDATVELARARLRPGARIAAYGSRRGICVATTAAIGDASHTSPSWIELLADDVTRFGQRGCMSPSHLFVLGDDGRARILAAQLGQAIATTAQARAQSSGALCERMRADAAALDAMTSSACDTPVVVVVGEYELSLTVVRDARELEREVRELGSLLQTAVVACAPAERDGLEALLYRCGCTRVCMPGEAHAAPASWPHDGIGRAAPLLGVSIDARPRPAG